MKNNLFLSLFLAVLVGTIFIKCTEVVAETVDLHAAVSSLPDDDTKAEIVFLLDQLDIKITEYKNDITTLTIENTDLTNELIAKQEAFDSLMIIINNQMSDTYFGRIHYYQD